MEQQERKRKQRSDVGKKRESYRNDNRSARAVEKANMQAAKKRARDDPDSGRVVYCKHEDCKYHGIPKVFTGSSYKACACGRGMAFA